MCEHYSKLFLAKLTDPLKFQQHTTDIGLIKSDSIQSSYRWLARISLTQIYRDMKKEEGTSIY